MIWLLTQAAFAAPIEITVTDSAVERVLFTCDEGSFEAKVHLGKAQLPERVTNCKLQMVRKAGVISGPGTYTCDLNACKMDQVEHKPVSDAPGRVNIIVTGAYQAQALELTCTDGFRERSAIETNTAIFNDVPTSDCTLFFKQGGPPAKYRGVTAGKTYFCSVNGAAAVCVE